VAAGEWSAVSIEAAAYRWPDPSQTFHGRDIFAPAAAHLAAGVPLERLGPPLTDPVQLPLPGCREEKGELVGEVIASDRFGNLLTSVTADHLAALAGQSAVAVELGGRALGPLVRSFADGPVGAPGAIVGSSGRLEIFVRNGSARDLLEAGCGTPVRVRRT